MFASLNVNGTTKVIKTAMDNQLRVGLSELSDESINIALVKICEEAEIDNELVEVCNMVESAVIGESEYDKELVDFCCRLDSCNSQPLPMESTVKRINYEVDKPTAKRIKVSVGASTAASGNNSAATGQVMCDQYQCLRFVSEQCVANNLKMKNKVLTTHISPANVSVIDSAFGQRLISYRIKSKPNESDETLKIPELFLNSVKDDIQYLFKYSIKALTIVKVSFILRVDFMQQIKNVTNSFDFQTCNYTVSIGDDLNTFLISLFKTLTNKISAVENKHSGWSLMQINYLQMHIHKFNPLRGTAYINLPNDIKLKKAVINVQNSDNMCLKWALLSALYPNNKNSNRVSSYSTHSNKLNFNGITFPVKLCDISKIEQLNNISINVFGLEFNREKEINEVIGPLVMTKCRKIVHVNLLYLKNGSNGHYCYIKNMSRLVSRQISNQEHAIYICDGCLLNFPTQQRLLDHQQNDCAHVKICLPDDKITSTDWYGKPVASNKIKFEKFNNKLKIPFVIYAGFKTFLSPINACYTDPSTSYTDNIRKPEVYSFGYYIKCSYDDKLSKYETYSGPDCAIEFMKRLYEDVKLICKKNTFQKSPKPLSNEDNKRIFETETCRICETNLNEDKTVDYDFYTGTMKGVAHELCLQKFRTPQYIPVFLHNLRHCDAHFIVQAINLKDGDINIIPQNKEKFISISKTLTVNNRHVTLRFVDSDKFLYCSLDQLAKNLDDNQFQDLKRNYPGNEDFIKLKKKVIYPYEYMTSLNSLKLKSLPTQNEFNGSLTDSCHVCDDDYNHAKDVWQHFCCQNMSDYSDLYLKRDVLLLTDVFENFRELCLKVYGLDPAHYYTAPGLSWDAMLKYTKTELELLIDYEQIAFFKAGIRGGISQCSHRYAKANNQFMDDYDSNKPQSFLIYLDANNSYGWAMSEYLPTGSFEWVSPDTKFDVSNESEFGFVLEVDLEYPNELHDLHSDLPLCPENTCIGDSKDKTLVTSLKNKIKYIIHYRNLKQSLNMGMKLNKVHRILKFKQSPWLRKYIDLNTNMRTTAKSVFEKDFYKLMNNSIYGKTIENIEKRVNVKLLTHWENRRKVSGVSDYVARPNFNDLTIFSPNLVAVHLLKSKLNYNKPIYLGFCILDISKTLIYDFHFTYMMNKFKNKTKLLYTDTDSLIYQIFTDNLYKDLKPDLVMYFDTSDYPTDNIYGYHKMNMNKLGFFKDECNGVILKEFVGLRSKMYAIDVENKFNAKTKGGNKSGTRNMQMANYKSCIFDENIFGSMLEMS